MKSRPKTLIDRLTLKGIPSARKHFYFYALLVLIAIVAHKAKESLSTADMPEVNTARTTHMTGMATATKALYQ